MDNLIENYIKQTLKSNPSFINLGLLLIIASSMFPSISLGIDITDRFMKLKAQYADVNTMHIRASAAIKDNLSTGTIERKNDYEYWGMGENYRVNSSFVDNGDYKTQYDTAYNGKRFQIFEKHNSRFSYCKDNKDSNPFAPENPFLAPLLFMSKDDDNCPACTLKFADIRENNTWDEKMANARLITVSDQTKEQTVVEIPGGILRRNEFVFHVYFGSDYDYLPVKINRVSTKGELLNSMEITYEPINEGGKQTYWPKLVSQFVFDKDRNIVASLISTINQYQINERFSSDIFTIDFSSAEIVWDGDMEMLLRQKGGFSPAKYLDDPFKDSDSSHHREIKENPAAISEEKPQQEKLQQQSFHVDNNDDPTLPILEIRPKSDWFPRWFLYIIAPFFILISAFIIVKITKHNPNS
jgi:hypothetical protein